MPFSPFSSPATRYSPPCPVESCFFIPPGRATAAQPLSSFGLIRPPLPAIGGNAASILEITGVKYKGKN